VIFNVIYMLDMWKKEPIIYETYIQTGKVNLVFFKHLPNRGSDSMGPAIAAQCTNDQGKFWE
jgi:protein-disulfide isomerase